MILPSIDLSKWCVRLKAIRAGPEAWGGFWCASGDPVVKKTRVGRKGLAGGLPGPPRASGGVGDDLVLGVGRHTAEVGTVVYGG